MSCWPSVDARPSGGSSSARPPPTATERATLALFPTRWRNRDGSKAISLSTFNRDFRDWVDELDLGGHYVSHQARHTLATNLLRHGAGLHHIRRYLGHVSDTMTEHYRQDRPVGDRGRPATRLGRRPRLTQPREVLSHGITSMNRQQAQALALDLSRRATPAEGGFCTFQPVVAGNACRGTWTATTATSSSSPAPTCSTGVANANSGPPSRTRPDDATADYLHQVFEPTARAIDGLEKALAALGLLDEALKLDMRRPQDYFNRIWSTAFRAADLANHTAHEHTDDQTDDEAGEDT